MSLTSTPLLLESIKELPTALSAISAERLFLVLDKGAYEFCGAKSALETCFANKVISIFDRFELNPKIEDVERGIEQYRNFRPDIVIALGGGTAIDLAKLISAFAVQKSASRDIAVGRASIEDVCKPLIAIPTTAGTGSEATHFAVVYVDGEKYSVANQSLLPTYAVLDWTLTQSLPRNMTAATGLDAFCQAIESIWAVAANEESLTYALEAAQLAFTHLPAATNAPTEVARRAMCRASHLAGRAINITKTTAPHALSYYLTSRHGVPHGMAVACTLTRLLDFNAGVTEDDCCDPRGAQAVRERIGRILGIVGSTGLEEASEAIKKMLSSVGCPSLPDIIEGDDLSRMVDSVNVERLMNNPRRASRSQLLRLLSR